MCKLPRIKKKVLVCTGPGCKAWKSERFIDRFSWNGLNGRADSSWQVCAAPCMSKCGGGVSIKTSLNDQVLKVKEFDNRAGLSLLIEKKQAAVPA